MSYKTQKRARKSAIASERLVRRSMHLARIAKPYKRPPFKAMTSESEVIKRLQNWDDISKKEHDQYPSLPLQNMVRKDPFVEHDAEYMRRECVAREIAEERKKMVAPLYSKGSYQYIGDAPKEIIQNLGRKI